MRQLKIHKAELIPDFDEDTGETIPVLMCLVEIDGELYKDFVFDALHFDYAYEIINHVNKSIEPYIIEWDEYLGEPR